MDSNKPRDPSHILRNYEFSSQELRALEECARESFYYRCLPFSTLFMSATYYFIQTGRWKRNKTLGAVPKLITAYLLGFILGKIAYQPRCEEKFMAIPDSYLGHLIKDIRDRK